ncbi:MAG: SUMF1/EgtB/PvdO family nonheme iron enzyme [Alphaproteobacteria bacterium]|nr:SUMF1/EgtB/PvdO family nonheme iron enzyme [Alphaproteobacteria bacterium]
MLVVLLASACKAPVTPVDSDPPTAEDTAPPADTAVDPPIDTAPPRGEPWVVIEGGTFLMGTPSPSDEPTEEPQHSVTMPGFYLMRHEIQSTDYWQCVDEGVCTPVEASALCSDGTVAGLPQNCIDWYQATAFCDWFGGRLPTESEWEFAASSRGADNEFPWGNEPPDCDRANVNQGPGISWCPGANGLWLSCTHPLGDTPLGLCDMAGNAFEWTQDWFHNDYTDHPADGSAQVVQANEYNVMRGGGIGSAAPVRVRKRTFHPRDFWYGGMGARCAADL